MSHYGTAFAPSLIACPVTAGTAGRRNMAARRRNLEPGEIEGLEYFDALTPLLARLRDIGTERDRAGNRQLF